MADKDQDGPSLELPSLGFGRKKRRGRTDDTVVQEPVAAEPVAPAPAPAEPETPTEVIPPTPSAAEPQRPLFADEAPTPLEPAVPAASEPVSEADTHTDTEAETDAPGGERKTKHEFALPDIGGMPAAVLTGLLVGVLTVGLTWAGFRLCEVVQGTSSCGNPGFLLLVAIVIVMIYLGGALLKAFRVNDPGSTSFLAVGLMAVVALLFLIDVLFSWSMIIVIPIVAMATYALAHWVTTAFIESAED